MITIHLIHKTHSDILDSLVFWGTSDVEFVDIDSRTEQYNSVVSFCSKSENIPD